MHHLIAALAAPALLAPEGGETSSGGAAAPAPAPASPEAAPATAAEPAKPAAGLTRGDAINAELAEVVAERSKAEGDKPPAGEKKPEAAPAAEPAKPKPEEEEQVTTRDRLALRQRESAVAEREQALAAREKDLEGKAKLPEADSKELGELRALVKGAAADPIGALEALGLNAQQVFEALKKGRPAVDPVARQALEEAKAARAELAEERKAKAKAEEAAGLDRYRSAITETITKGGEALEFLAARGAAGVQDVQEAAVAYFQRYGKSPDLAKVAAAVDKHYEDEFKATTSLKRAQGLLKPAAPAPAPAPATPAKPAAPTRTLTNEMDAKPPPAKPSAGKYRSYDEEVLADLAEVQKKRGANG